MKLFRSPAVRAFAAFLAVVIIGAIFHSEGAFFKPGTHRDMLRQVSEFGILACGMTLVIITGGIDLAVGSVLALSAVLFAKLSIQQQWSAPLAILVCIAVGTLCGVTSGGIIARFRIQPFIATLAMMVFARGLAKYVSQGEKVSTAITDKEGNVTNVDLPAVFSKLDASLFNNRITVVTIIFIACLLVCWVLLRHLRYGRYFYAVGGNEEASRLSGVPVGGTKVLAYAISGALAAIAGICHAAQETQGDPEAGMGYELNAIAMVVIGGTSLAGGRGSIWLTLLGVLTIGYLEKILSINAVGEENRLMLTGAIIIGAVLFQKSRR